MYGGIVAGKNRLQLSPSTIIMCISQVSLHPRPRTLPNSMAIYYHCMKLTLPLTAHTAMSDYWCEREVFSDHWMTDFLTYVPWGGRREGRWELIESLPLPSSEPLRSVNTDQSIANTSRHIRPYRRCLYGHMM